MHLLWSKLLSYLYLFSQEWRITWLDIWHETSSRWLAIIDLILLTITWILAFWLAAVSRGGLLILHYNINFGIDLIGSANSIYWLPTGATIAFVINSLLLLINYPAAKQFRTTSLAGSLSVLALVNLALASLLLINFR
ncbi:hypothetical protein EOM71_02495 [Candidatus Falkowbacteria bacterium]|jgi:hypothetical protein|nr:hypothetical protein [Candidatus Falkowbacteria bacterium]